MEARWQLIAEELSPPKNKKKTKKIPLKDILAKAAKNRKQLSQQELIDLLDQNY